MRRRLASRKSKSIRFKCSKCGRKLTKNDLINFSSGLKPLYSLNNGGEYKPLCVTCYHELIGLYVIRQLRNS
jgi:transposase-like protein